ncbi:MAG: heavy metal-binding domain-containing protein [Armatimonadota bacterium]
MHRMLLVVCVAVAVAVVVGGCTPEPAPTPVEPAGPTPTTTGPTEEPPEVAAGEVTYHCPMHPDVEQGEPGECPECGMFLEAKLEAGQEATYVCPMPEHEVEQDTPGKCPKCGMFLEARLVEGAEPTAEPETPAGEEASHEEEEEDSG